MGQWAEYSKELEESRLRPWAEMLASSMLVVAGKHIPSDRVLSAFNPNYQFTPGKGGGTRIVLNLPEDWNRLAYWLLAGVAPHIIWPIYTGGLWWEAWTQGYGGGRGAAKTKGAPNRAPKVIYQPDRPLRYVIHPGFKGYDYISKIEEDVLTDEVLGPGGIATKIGKDAEIALTPSGKEAIAAGSRRRVKGFRRVRKLFPHRFKK